MKRKKIKLSIVIPVWNEGVNIKAMLKILTSLLDIPHEILVVYDTKEDDTIPVVKKMQRTLSNIYLIHNKLGRGVTNAIKSGTAKAQGEYVLIFATDDIGPVLAIEDMLFLAEKGCKLVSATRYAHGGKRLGGSLVQAILSKLGNYFFRVFIGTTLTDSTTGIKMFRKDIFDTITLESKIGWAGVFELAIKAQMIGMQLGEVPIMSIDRLYGGASTFKVSPWFREYLKWFIFGITHLRTGERKKKVRVRIPQNLI